MKNVLTIAGSDCSGGAGIQADLKTMCALGVYGMSVVTAITAQNTQGVYGVQAINSDIVAGQIDAVYNDIRIDAVKIGMVSDAVTARTIREGLARHHAGNIVLDPVMVSKSRYRLLREDAEIEVKNLIPQALIITPNILEAELLADMTIASREAMAEAGRRIRRLGAGNVLVKSGVFQGEDAADDLLVAESGEIWIRGPRIHTVNTHGSGCTLSAAIACCLAKGQGVVDAVRSAKDYVTQAIRDGYNPGHGVGPLGHLAELHRKTRPVGK